MILKGKPYPGENNLHKESFMEIKNATIIKWLKMKNKMWYL